MAATITRTLRNVGEVVVTTAQQLPKRRVVTLTVAIVILVALALLVPLPTAVQLRDWSRSLGPWFPLAFLAAHTVITVLPFPRTAFTLAAGLLFGTGYGVLIAVTASTVSAVHRAPAGAGRRLAAVQPGEPSGDRDSGCPAAPTRLAGRPVAAADPGGAVRGDQLRGRAPRRSGCCPTALATLVGILPGTAAVVILGDAFTGNVSPMLALVSVGTASLGVAGLVYEIRKHRRESDAGEADED